MVLPFTLSACRTALWPFLRHWQWRRETHEGRQEWKWQERQDKRRQVTSSINCSSLLIRRHRCNVTIDNCKGSLGWTSLDKWLNINDVTNDVTNIMFMVNKYRIALFWCKSDQDITALWKCCIKWPSLHRTASLFQMTLLMHRGGSFLYNPFKWW